MYDLQDALGLILDDATKNTRRVLLTKWKAWSNQIGREPTGREGVAEARAFVASLKRRNIVQSTIWHYVVVLKSIYDKLLEMHAVKTNPFASLVKEVKKGSRAAVRPTKLTPYEKVAEMIRACDTLEDQAMLAILYGAGRRIGELTKIRREDIHYTEQDHLYIKLRATKNGEDFDAVIPDDYKKIIEALAAQRQPGELLFRESYKTLYRHFKKVAARAGVDASPHSGRATSITFLLQEGCDYQQVKEFAGHKSILMVSLYDKRRFQKDTSPALKINFGKTNKNTKK